MLSCNLVPFRLNGKHSDDNKTDLHMFNPESDNCGLQTLFVGVNTSAFVFVAFWGSFIQSDVLSLFVKLSLSDFRALPVWISSLLTGSSVPSIPILPLMLLKIKRFIQNGY